MQGKGTVQMFSLHKRVFAGKTNLQTEPFSPLLTNASGRMSLQRSYASRNQSNVTPRVRPSIRDGKRYF